MSVVSQLNYETVLAISKSDLINSYPPQLGGSAKVLTCYRGCAVACEAAQTLSKLSISILLKISLHWRWS